jgi:hypothetical protein
MKKIIIILLLLLLSGYGYVMAKQEGITGKEIEMAGEKVIIGGDKLLGAKNNKFKPEVKLTKWDEEVAFKVWSEEEVEDRATEKDGKIISKTKDGKKEFNFYSTKFKNNDAFEYEIILKEKPETNIISLKIDLSGINCYYQPPLNEEMNDSSCTPTDCQNNHRPENVVGSYACYHKSKSGDYSQIGGKNYMAGKAFHIYRPQMEDINGIKVWGKLKINGNNLIVTIPQEFLDNAVYPIKHAAGLTFGYTSIGLSSLGGDDVIAGTFFAPTSNGTVSSISAYYTHTNDTAKNCKHALYSYTSATDIGSLIGLTAQGQVGNSVFANWVTLTFSTPPSITSGTNYYLVSNTAYSSGNLDYRYDSATGSNIVYKSTNYNTWPDPITGESAFTNKIRSIYATYIASATGDDAYATSTIKTGTLQIKTGTFQIK